MKTYLSDHAAKAKKKRLIYSLIVLAVIIAIGAALVYFIGISENEYAEAYDVYEEEILVAEILPAEDEEEPEEKEEEYEPVPEPRPIMSKVLALREEYGNDDIIGHLRIYGTNINYLVVQYYDNEFYLHHDVFGQPSLAGVLFLDYENDAANLSLSNIIYGHNMGDGSKFHNVRYYRDRDFFDNHRYIHFTTLHYETIWEAFAFYDTHISFNYIQVDFSAEGSFMALVEEMKYRSMHKTGIQVSEDDKILTLSTCTNTHMDWRYVINAKLISRVSAEELGYYISEGG